MSLRSSFSLCTRRKTSTVRPMSSTRLSKWSSVAPRRARSSCSALTTGSISTKRSTRSSNPLFTVMQQREKRGAGEVGKGLRFHSQRTHVRAFVTSTRRPRNAPSKHCFVVKERGSKLQTEQMTYRPIYVSSLETSFVPNGSSEPKLRVSGERHPLRCGNASSCCCCCGWNQKSSWWEACCWASWFRRLSC